MKLFSSFIKELKIASRGYYFYIEIFMAILILVIFLFAVPDNFNSSTTEYVYLDMPSEVSEVYLDGMLKETVDNKANAVTVEIDKEDKDATLYTMEDSEIYVLNSREDAISIAENDRKISSVIVADAQFNVSVEYYLQGYESDRFKNLLRIIHVESGESLEAALNSQDVRPLAANVDTLSDRENMMPSVLVFNGALMGLFIMAAYIFLDRQEGVIKAHAITPSPVWKYLVSKIGVLMVTSIVSSLLVVIPIMGLQPDYLLLLVLLMTTAFFASSLGLLLASFYENIMQAFGVLYLFMMLMIVPNISYFMPTWSPGFVKFIPTYYMLEGFKSVILGNGDWVYVLSVSGGFLGIGLILFMYSDYRYKKTLIG